MRYCKYCGTLIPDDATVCPNCQKNIASREANVALKPTETKDKTCRSSAKKRMWLIGVGIAALMVVILMLSNSGRCAAVGCKNKAAPGSDYCYAHKCAISDCNEERCCMSNYCYEHHLILDEEDDLPGYGSGSVYEWELEISNVRLSSNSGYTIAEGSITNNGNSRVEFVEIKGLFRDYSGTVIDTDWTYAVGSEGLDPGETCKWRMSVDKDSRISECTVKILDYDD